MILTASEIQELGIVIGAVASEKPSTYDATVGTIISSGIVVTDGRFKLPPRGIVWVVSHETFSLPNDVTGIATLRTTWTHRGILSLNVGIIDPSWSGPLAAAIVNFGNSDFVVAKGDAFLRVVFSKHNSTSAQPHTTEVEEYIGMTIDRSIQTGDSFMNIGALADEVSRKLFGSGNWTSRLSFWALIVAVIAIFFPVAYGVTTDYVGDKTKVSALERQVEELQREQSALQSEIAPLVKSTHG